ncbi:MAG TPA: PilZ domain-containing protein [Terracidiphilus sp.]|nr:PilZ domain-containing protein [Terracidiphilus sp.]
MQPLERFQPNIFLMGSITMEKGLKTSEESKTLEMPKRAEELRQSPRLGCRGFGAIQTLPASERPCAARILNLSVGGCLMEVKGPLDLALDEIVELIFNINQMPFRVRAKVRSIRLKGLVGFQFLQLSERTRRYLHELIGELIENLVKLHKKELADHPDKEDTKKPKTH